jgi:hypothetical protein
MDPGLKRPIIKQKEVFATLVKACPSSLSSRPPSRDTVPLTYFKTKHVQFEQLTLLLTSASFRPNEYLIFAIILDFTNSAVFLIISRDVITA